MKKFSYWIIVLVLMANLLSACSGQAAFPSFATDTLPPVSIQVTKAPSPEAAARMFLEAWQNQEYAVMHGLITSLSRDAMTLEEFAGFYNRVQSEATLQTLEYQILSVTQNARDAEVSFEVTWQTVLVGNITRTMLLQLKNQDGGWKIAWDEGAVLPELKGGNLLAMRREPTARGNIYDRNGLALAYQADVVSIGVVPGQIDTETEDYLLGNLREVLQRSELDIYNAYAYQNPDWYVPLGILSRDEMKFYYDALLQLNGVVLHKATTRYYYGGGTASHLIGYIGQPSPEELSYYQSLGYAGDERVGKMGLEAWGEQYLAGKPGAKLYVTSPGGSVLAVLAQADAVPAMSIYTTLDRDLQSQMERYVMGPLTGAAVVLKRDSGEVLAMISSPRFDSNVFNLDNFQVGAEQSRILSDLRTPLLNRAAQGQYPLGSVFKIITMAAALESGAFRPDSKYVCDGYFREIPGLTLTDWTIEHETKPHGEINLIQGLIRSCNTYFWHIGLDLYYRDAWLVPNMARGFGLGKATGIQVIPEEKGFVPDPAWKNDVVGENWTEGDAVNQVIGQGMLQVTPLQVVDYVAAVGNGGTLYRPQLIFSIKTFNNESVFDLTPEARGLLPLSESNLKAIQEAMTGVVYDRNGTGRARFIGISDTIRIAGKTGTASDLPRFPHAWFAAYTFGSNYANRDDIAVVAIVQNIGEGSTYAAPMVRRIMEIYYRGQPYAYYAWESTYGVMGTATPDVTDTPEFLESPTAAP